MSYQLDESDNEEDIITPLEYSRLNGLSLDYLSNSRGDSEVKQLQAQLVDPLNDGPELPHFDFGFELKVEERLVVSKEAASLLASVVHDENIEAIRSLISTMTTPNISRNLRLELPLLKTDNQNDCKEFSRRESFEIPLEDVRLPLEVVDEEKNEGLSWPISLWRIGIGTLNELKMEKISVSKDTIEYLQDNLRISWTEADESELWNHEQKYKWNTALNHITPPLSPLPGFQQPYEPSSDPACQLPLFSDPISPTKKELEELEREIFNQDIPTHLRRPQDAQDSALSSLDTYVGNKTITLGEIYPPLKSESPPLIETKHVKRETLKIEEPLTPEYPAASLPKTVRFSDVIEEMELDSGSCLGIPVVEDNFFEDAFGDLAQRANKELEQEKLIEADSTARVDIPIVDFSKPHPPWKLQVEPQNQTSSCILQRSFIQRTTGFQPEWFCSKQGIRDLKWNPFPHSFAQVALEENPQDFDDRKWEALVECPSVDKIIDSSALTWKRPGLMILKDHNDEDELEQGIFHKETSREFSFLVKKRKLGLHESDSCGEKQLTLNTPAPIPGASSLEDPYQAKTSVIDGILPTTEKMRIEDTNAGLGTLLGGAFSAEISLDNYLELRGAKKPKLTKSHYFAPNPEEKHSLTPETSGIMSLPALVQVPIRNSPVINADPLPAPSFQAPRTKTKVIASSTLFKNRALIKHLENLLPRLIWIERDLSAHNTTTWLHGSVTRSPITSPLAHEADIIVSPTMGFILTTLQKIKQKLLPGQKGKTPIRERVERTSVRYERLDVFISEGKTDEITNGLDECDSLALSEFIGFTLGLNTTIAVYFVGGGDGTLARWLASRITKCVVEEELIEEETHWELFLRRAGMNAFAAQVVITLLKAPDGVDSASPTKAGQFGLTKFVEMGYDQRVARFGARCGKRVLQRVSSAIDKTWE